MGSCGLIGQIPRLPQPMEALRLHPDLLIDADRGRSLPEPLVGSLDELGAYILVIKENTGLP